jgi:hypothetical protein
LLLDANGILENGKPRKFSGLLELKPGNPSVVLGLFVRVGVPELQELEAVGL